MKKNLLLLLALFTLNKVFAQPANTNISNTTFFAGEPFLAINPTNASDIIIAWMAADLSTGFRMAIKTKTSFDGGQTWGNQDIKPHFSPNWGSADVSMAFRKNGTVYLSYVDYKQGPPDSGGVYITHSVNGGVTWTPPTKAWNGTTEDVGKSPLDRPWIAVDNSTVTTQGMFYMTTKPAPWIPLPNRAYLKTSPDSGATWGTYHYVDTANFLIGSSIQAPMTALCVAADGALCMAYPSYVPSQSVFGKIFFAKSYNKGQSFQRYDLLVNPSSVPNANYKLGYNITANPLNANQLAASFINNQNGDPDVYITTTNNGGLNWSTPVRANDDALSNGKAQDLVWTNYSKNNKLVSVWRDKRNGAGTGFYQPSDVYCAVSTNNGATFQTNIRLSNISTPHDTILTQSGNDFLSCELVNDTIYAAWGDVRTGKLNIYFAKTSITSGVGIKPYIINNEDALQVFTYPNPASDKLFLKFNNDNLLSADLSIYDVLGKMILSKKADNNKTVSIIDVSVLKEGTYFIRVENEKQLIYFDKLVISK